MKNKPTTFLLVLFLGSSHIRYAWTFCHNRPSIGNSSLQFQCGLFQSQKDDAGDGSTSSKERWAASSRDYYNKLKRNKKSLLTSFLFRRNQHRRASVVGAAPSSSSCLFSTTADEQQSIAQKKKQRGSGVSLSSKKLNVIWFERSQSQTKSFTDSERSMKLRSMPPQKRKKKKKNVLTRRCEDLAIDGDRRSIRQDILQTVDAATHVASRVQRLQKKLELENINATKNEKKVAEGYNDNLIELKHVATRRKMLENRLSSEQKSRAREDISDVRDVIQPPTIVSQDLESALNNLKGNDKIASSTNSSTSDEVRHVKTRMKLLKKRLEYDAKALEDHRAKLRLAAETKQVRVREKLLRYRLRRNLKMITQKNGCYLLESGSATIDDQVITRKDVDSTATFLDRTTFTPEVIESTKAPTNFIDDTERRAEQVRRKLLEARIRHKRPEAFEHFSQPEAIYDDVMQKQFMSKKKSLHDDNEKAAWEKRQVSSREKMLQRRLFYEHNATMYPKNNQLLGLEARHVSTREKLLQRRLKQQRDAYERTKSCDNSDQQYFNALPIDAPDERTSASVFGSQGDDVARSIFDKSDQTQRSEEVATSKTNTSSIEKNCHQMEARQVATRVKMMERRFFPEKKSYELDSFTQEATLLPADRSDPPSGSKQRVISYNKPQRNFAHQKYYFVSVVEDNVKTAPESKSMSIASSPISAKSVNNGIGMRDASTDYDFVISEMENMVNRIKLGFSGIFELVMQDKSEKKPSVSNTASMILTFGWVSLCSEYVSSFIDVIQTIPFAFIIAKMLTENYLQEHTQDD
eukprot:CAMPEP_0196801926 /NCGR_PEP_ID=MMETSP1362-20130617/1697_1 /TAXON_ID=163516 /ORGANISM="Leptocylindrus danicus, Strain CCMP1856" /LENGTH=805 /DNA_ID=CAMNT_0042173113 /DNA_START=106 /DNA_END=2523 /DNA_ORIENTATION=+